MYGIAGRGKKNRTLHIGRATAWNYGIRSDESSMQEPMYTL
ncbi:MAG: hypothetical protein ACLU80_17505 [Dorea sp.]